MSTSYTIHFVLLVGFNLIVATAIASDIDAAKSGATAIAEAAEVNDGARVALLLKQHLEVNARQADGMTALLWASHHDNLTMTKALVRADVDVNATNRYNISALTLACRNGNNDIVQLLLKNGANANTEANGGETVLMTASRTGRLKVVQSLLSNGAKVDAKDHRGQTAIMWAAADGHTDVVDALIKTGADFRTSLKSGFTPLSFAVRNGHIGVTRRLLAAKVNLNEAMTQARGGRNMPVKNTSPLLLAMENGHFELASILLDAGSDPNDTRTGFAPLHAISWIRKPEIGDNESGNPPPTGTGRLTSLQFVRALVKHGAKVNIQKKAGGSRRRKISVTGTTPFLAAAGTADIPLMKTLLELGANAKLANSQGHTALMMAAGIGEGAEADGAGTKQEHYDAVAFLLKLGAEVNAIDKSGETAMHAAAYKSLPDVIHLLADRGADIKIWAKKTKQGRTPLSIAQGFRPGNFKPSFETVAAIKKVMIARGVTPPPPPNRQDGDWEK